MAAESTAITLDGAAGAWDWDIAADRLYADARFAGLYGLDPDAARKGLPTSAFFAPIDAEDRMRVRIAVAGILHGAELFAREYRVAVADNGVGWVSAKGGLVLDEDGRPSRFTGLLSDITEQKRIQEQLRVAQSAGGVGSFEYVSGFGTASVSPQFCALLGLYPADALPVRTINAVVAAGQPPIILGMDAEPGDQSAYAEFRIARADTGEERWLARRGEILRDSVGTRFVGVVYDVTTAKASETRLTELARTLEARVETRTRELDRLWNLSRDLFAVCDLDGRFLAINPAWATTLGYGEGDLAGVGFETLAAPEDALRAEAMFEALRAGGPVAAFECRFRHASGDYAVIDWSGAAEDGEIVLTGRDVSQRRQLEDQLRQSQKMEAVGQLTGGLAHDFNNMLTGIMGALDLIQRRISEGRTNDLDRFMKAAMASSERAASLTHRLLAFSRRQSLDNRAVDVNDLIRSMEDLLSRTLGEQTRLDVALSPEIWPGWSDANQLESALLNLAINARDAMPAGGVLSIRSANATVLPGAGDGDLAPGDYVQVSVSDTGMGMAPDVLKKVFDPFFTTKAIGQGTGLGLSMIYGFMRQAGGGVTIESAPGQGTAIHLYLPKAEVEAARALEPARRASPHGRGETILLVEDDPSVRLLVMDVLEELGYAPLEASEAQSALGILRERPVDLLITDVGLPGMNGRELAETAMGLQPGLQVLFMTGYAEQASDRTVFLAPGMAMITKPFAMDSLAVEIRRIMSPLAVDEG